MKPSNPRARLHDFLQSSFDEQELRTLVRVFFGPEACHQFPSSGTRTELCEALLDYLERHGHLDSAFFLKLAALRPKKRGEIAAIASEHVHPPETPLTSPSGTLPTPVASPSPLRATFPALSPGHAPVLVVTVPDSWETTGGDWRGATWMLRTTDCAGHETMHPHNLLPWLSLAFVALLAFLLLTSTCAPTNTTMDLHLFGVLLFLFIVLVKFGASLLERGMKICATVCFVLASIPVVATLRRLLFPNPPASASAGAASTSTSITAIKATAGTLSYVAVPTAATVTLVLAAASPATSRPLDTDASPGESASRMAGAEQAGVSGRPHAGKAGPSAILAPIDRTTTVALPLTDGSLPSPAPAPAPQGGLLETGKSPRAPLGASGTQPVRPRMHPGGSASPSRAACTTSMRFVPPSTAPFKSGGGKHDVMGLCVDETETTVVAYRKCVEKGVCTPPAGLDWRSQARDRYPISGVTWDQAVTFCKHQSKRLPTEWEWEWVARGREENHPYPWGNTPPHCGLTVMLGPGGRGCGRGAAAEVGRRLGDRTRDGVVDMGGNLSEWTASAMREDRKSVRGGSFIASQSADFSVSHRRTHVSTHQSVDIGFRCVRSPGKGGKG